MQTLSSTRKSRAAAYWKKNLLVVAGLLAVWFTVSYLLGIVFVEPLNASKLGGFPLGFWFAHQGSILVFIVLIFVYCIVMDRLDRAAIAAEQRAETQAAEPAANALHRSDASDDVRHS